jgi:type II secretion system protein I
MIAIRPRAACPIRDSRGMTLLEVMVALVIAGLLLTAVMHAFAQGIRAQARMQNMTIAALCASREALETFTNPQDRPGPGGSDEFTPEAPYDYLSGTRTVEQHELLPNVNQITITVFWETGATVGSEHHSRENKTGSQSVEICFLQSQLTGQ